MYSKSKKIIQDDLEQWFVESFWLESGAITALLKDFQDTVRGKRHSIEIDQTKTFIILMFQVYFKISDKICFISKAKH